LDVLAEVLGVELVLDLRFDRRVDLQGPDVVPVDVVEPGMLQNVIGVGVADSLRRIFLQALIKLLD
jgi:hypothetical protein